MWEFATKDLLRRNVGTITESAAIIKRASEKSPSGKIFLSHSSQDAEFLPGLVKLLSDHGGDVYVDKKDSALPPHTSRETAAMLRNKIAEAGKFILFATKNSKDSRWVPWELGLSDGLKRSSGMAVFPGVDNLSDVLWTEQEYLGLYDRIVYGDLQGQAAKVWMVLNQPKNTATALANWLKG
jgi:hypothetical protein